MYTYEQMIHDKGEIPTCSCPDCQQNGKKVIIHPDKDGSYIRYKNHDYPRYIHGHNNGGKKFTNCHREKLRQAKLGKKASLEAIENLSKSHLGQKVWNEGLHPEYMQGKPSIMKGKHHKQSSKDMIRTKLLGIQRSEEFKSKHSGSKNPMFGISAPHPKKIFPHLTPLQGLLLMYRWDRKEAQYLDSIDEPYLYEYKAFPLILNKKEVTYTPDFYLPKNDLYIEVKGFFRGDAKQKFEAFKQQYPGIKIKLLMNDDLKSLGINIKITPEEREIMNNYRNMIK